MAGLIAALFGGKSRPQDNTNPAPGIGGYAMGPGPAGQSGLALRIVINTPPSTPRSSGATANAWRYGRSVR